jgi:hypothetical protein
VGLVTVRTVTATSMQTLSGADRQKLAREYLRIVAPANKAHDALMEKTRSYDSNTTTEELGSNLAPVIAAYEDADNALRVNWPSVVAADVKALVAANGALIGDLRARIARTCCQVAAGRPRSPKTAVSPQRPRISSGQTSAFRRRPAETDTFGR